MNQPDHPTSPADAVVVLGVMFAGRYPRLFPAAAARRLRVLGVDGPSPFKQRVDAARRSDPTHPLASVAELAWIPGDQHEEVIEQVLTWSRQHRIRGVLAFGEDFVEVAGLVCDLLDLPGPGLRASRVCRNKHLQRRYLARWSPQSRLIGADRDIAWDTFPAVLKPVGREASSGVQRIDDPVALSEALTAYEPGEELLIEELVDGHEVSVESLVQQGRVIFASVTGKLTNESGSSFFVEMGHTVPDPALDEQARAAVLTANAEILTRLSFGDGIAHAEYRIRADGSVVLMELAARAPGDSILTLYQLACGTPMEPALLDIATGHPAGYPAPSRYARQVYLPHPTGVLRDVTADGLGVPVTWLAARWAWPEVPDPVDGAEPASVRMVVVGRNRGDVLVPIRQSGDRLLMYILDAATVPELEELQRRCDLAIDVRVDAEVVDNGLVDAGLVHTQLVETGAVAG